jgi:hypothetical protein
MKIEYEIKSSVQLSPTDIKEFRRMLDKQGQVNTSIGKAELCEKICFARHKKELIGIGALKNVYQRPFDHAKVTSLKSQFEIELGYLFVDHEVNGKSFQGYGIGKKISKLLLNEIPTKNVFATTECAEENSMYHILKSFDFVVAGSPYLGRETSKQLCLMTRSI